MFPDKNRVIMDLTEYDGRIEKAEKKLMLLPEGWQPDYKLRKKNKQIRHAMESEIKHVHGLQKIVYEYLDENLEIKAEMKGDY